MFMGFCVLVLLAAIPLFRGDLRRLTGLHLRLSWVVFLALVVQVVVISLTPNGDPRVQAAAHVLTYAVVLVVIGVNSRLPGLPLIGLGTFSNALGIAANGGSLPASPSASAVAGFRKLGGGLENSAPSADAHLAFLGDQFVSPAFLPFRNVVSVGDLFILAGAMVLLWVITGARLPGVRARSEAV